MKLRTLSVPVFSQASTEDLLLQNLSTTSIVWLRTATAFSETRLLYLLATVVNQLGSNSNSGFVRCKDRFLYDFFSFRHQF